MEENYFFDCSNEELKMLWDYRDNFGSIKKNNPMNPYKERYCSTASKMPLILCELDFYKECARRFFENNT